MITYYSWLFNDMAHGVVPVPLWIPQLGYSGGLVILLIAIVDELVHVLRGNEPRYEKPKPQTAEEVVERAVRAPCDRCRCIGISIVLVRPAGGAAGRRRVDRRRLLAVGWLGMLFVGGIPAGSVLATTVWGNSASWELAALPLFIWMGEILFRTKLSEEMFRGLAPWLDWLPGRLMHVNVLACGMFGSVSGSSAATCATVAKIALPELKKRGYDEMLSLGSLAGAGTLGILIPPSITMVVYAVRRTSRSSRSFSPASCPACS